MAWVRFQKDFDFRPPVHGVTLAYKAGGEYSVTRACAEKAVAAGAAVRIKPPPRDTAKAVKDA